MNIGSNKKNSFIEMLMLLELTSVTEKCYHYDMVLVVILNTRSFNEQFFQRFNDNIILSIAILWSVLEGLTFGEF